jgi:hypothetical protein
MNDPSLPLSEQLTLSLCGDVGYSDMRFHNNVYRALMRARDIAENINRYAIEEAGKITPQQSGLDAWVEAFAWLYLAIIHGESLGGPALLPNGTGDNGHGWDEPQIDIDAHPDWVAQLKPMVYGDPNRRRMAIQFGAIDLGSCLQEYPTHPWAACSRYNCAKVGVDIGLKQGNPDLRTTRGNYGSQKMIRIAKWTNEPDGWQARGWPTILNPLAETPPKGAQQ